MTSNSGTMLLALVAAAIVVYAPWLALALVALLVYELVRPPKRPK